MTYRYALVAAAAVLVGLGGPAVAADDGYQNVFTSVLGAVGVMPKEDSPEIDYRERAPLVLPPKQVLVTPHEPGADRSAAWPADPDVVRRQKAAADARAPRRGATNRTDDQLMSKEEQLKYRAAQEPQEPYDDGCAIKYKSMSHCRIDPDEMKAEEERYKKMNPEKGETLTAGVEPERTYLTQPPKGYLKATKTIAATREAPQIKRDESSPLSSYIHPDQGKIDPLSN